MFYSVWSLVLLAELAGKTDFEPAQADMIVDCLEDAWKPILTFTFETKDETKKVTSFQFMRCD